MMGEKPLLADGSIVGDYTPLFKYWRKAREKGGGKAEDALLRKEDFEYLDELVAEQQGRISVAEALEKLRHRFEERIDPGLAAEAVMEAYGMERIDPVRARAMIAGIMAGWLVEAVKTLKKYKVGSPKPSPRFAEDAGRGEDGSKGSYKGGGRGG